MMGLTRGGFLERNSKKVQQRQRRSVEDPETLEVSSLTHTHLPGKQQNVQTLNL